MKYQIKRKTSGADLLVKEVTAIGGQQREAMGVDIVDMAFSLPSYTAFKLGDFVTVYDQLYKLNTIPDEQKISSRNYAYNLQFQAIWYDLAKVQMQMLNPQNQLLEPVFDITGNAATILGLIVENANRYSNGWTVGVVDETNYETFSFNAQNCLQALHEVASRFETEFWIDNQTIHLQKREQPSGVTFEYGKGNGLYTVSRKAKEGASLLTRLYVRGGSTNLPMSYGSNSLLLPNGKTYIQDDDKVNPALGGELIEATKVFPEIFPTRTGTVSGVVAGDGNWKYFFDTSLEFDIDDHLAAGLEAKVHFIDGDLAGYTFTISEYDHALKRFTINKNEDETALEIPSDTLRPKVGNKYRLIDLDLPLPYVTDAENRLAVAGQEYYNQNSDIANLREYSATVDRMFIKANNVDVVLGNTAILHDSEMGFTTELRIAKYTRNLQDAYDYTEVIWSEKISANEIIRQYQQQQKTLLLLESSGLLSVDQMRKNLFLNRLSERDGYLMLGAAKAKAGLADYAPEAGHALLANEAINADLWDGKQFADYLNQPVRDTDDVAFKSVKSKNFVSGALGSGFRIDQNGNAEFDNLVIRKSFQATEFILQKVRASNGAIAVTDSMIVQSVVELTSVTFKCFIETDGGNITPTFMLDDLVRCQVFDGVGFKYIFGEVTDVGDDYFTIFLINSTSPPAAGDTFIRIGNSSSTNRQGLIYMTNADNGAPYIDVLDGVESESLAGKTKVRLGKLDGIVDADLGALTGYGLYAQNGYFKGKVVVTGGNAQTIAGSQAQANAAQAAAAADATAKANAAEANAQVMVNAVKVGGRNLLTDTKNKTYTATWRYLTGLADGDQITVQLWGAGSVACYLDNGFQHAQTLNTVNGYGVLTYTVMPHTTNPNNNGTVLLVFNVVSTDIKVERGNKGTDWTPATEEVEAAVSAANAAAIAAQNATTALAASLKAMAFQDVVELSKLGTTVIEGGFIKTSLLNADYIKASVINTAYVNSLEIDAGAIKSGTIDSARINAAQIVVSGGGATQAYAQALVNGVIIGGRNMFKDGSFESGNINIFASHAIAVEVAATDKDGNPPFLGSKLLSANNFDYQSLTDHYFYFPQVMATEVGEQYTVSFYYKCAGAITDNSSFLLMGGTHYGLPMVWSYSTQWQRVTYTFTALAQTVQVRLGFGSTSGQPAWIAIDAVKVEKGNKVTDWTPAIEDVSENIEAAKGLAISTAAADATAKQLAAEANAQAQLDALKVGGRNLFRGYPTNSGIGLATTNFYIEYYPNIPLEPNTEYVFSFNFDMVNGNVADQRVGIGYGNLNGYAGDYLPWPDVLLSTRVYKFTTPAVLPAPYFQWRPFIDVPNAGALKNVTFYDVKFEKGNKQTGWSPAPEDVAATVQAANNAATAAQNANAALAASLKAMAYKDVVELAELGTTVIQGGKVRTNLLDADYIKASIVNAAYINTLEIVARNVSAQTGNIGAWLINSQGIADETGGAYVYSKRSFVEGGQVVGTFGGVDTNGVSPDTSIGSTLTGLSIINTRVTTNRANTAIYAKARGSSNMPNLAIDCDGNQIVRGTLTSLRALFLQNVALLTGGGLAGGIVSYFTDGSGRKVLCLGTNTSHLPDDDGLYWNDAQYAMVQYGPCNDWDPQLGSQVGSEHNGYAAANTFSSTVSKAAANAAAYDAALTQAQEDANNYGYCYWP